MTIGEDQVVSYIDEESQKIEQMLQEKRTAEVATAPGADAAGPAEGADGAVDVVDLSQVASVLASLLGGAEETEIVPKCARKSDHFYESEDGNDALAAGMFDISVVCAELGAHPTDSAAASAATQDDSGVESVEPSPSGTAQAAAAPEASAGAGCAAVPLRNKRIEVVRETVYNVGRPRTSSKAPDPDAAVSGGGPATAATLAGVTVGEYRPRTSSKARDPDDLAGGYRPRTSSRAADPDEVAGPRPMPPAAARLPSSLHTATTSADLGRGMSGRPRTTSRAPEPDSPGQSPSA